MVTWSLLTLTTQLPFHTTVLSGLPCVMLVNSHCPLYCPNLAHSTFTRGKTKEYFFFPNLSVSLLETCKKCGRRSKSYKKEELNGGSRSLHEGAGLQRQVQLQHLITALMRSQFIFTNEESYLNVIVKHSTTDMFPSHLQRDLLVYFW